MIRSFLAALAWAFGYGPDVPNIGQLRATRAKAFDAFVQARRSSDTQWQHQSRLTLNRATNALLRAELAQKAHSRAKLTTGAVGSR